MSEEQQEQQEKAAKAAPVDATAAPAEGAAPAGDAKAPRKARLKNNRHVPVGVVFVNSTFNNTHVAITDMRGGVIGWSTSGRGGFKGSRKSTAFAATMAAQDAARQALAYGLQEVEVRVQGPGAGRESAIRAIQSAGIVITAIRDITPMPHNGCRAPKRRRV
jgi:small subunit ribosomal protein S11